jgi:hypothetical protein
MDTNELTEVIQDIVRAYHDRNFDLVTSRSYRLIDWARTCKWAFKGKDENQLPDNGHGQPRDLTGHVDLRAFALLRVIQRLTDELLAHRFAYINWQKVGEVAADLQELVTRNS